MTGAGAARVVHHDLCFGCGVANLFGLQLEARADGADAVVGRFFVKQDHQGPPGAGHPGVLAAALVDAIALARGEQAEAPAAFELRIQGLPPVGSFVRVTARADAATACEDASGRVLAHASCPRT